MKKFSFVNETEGYQCNRCGTQLPTEHCRFCDVKAASGGTFTPGPWEIQEYSSVDKTPVVCGNGRSIVVACGRADTSYLAENQANARLIASAPELLAMLKAANEAFFGRGTRQELLKALKDSKELIRRVEGRE